MGWRLMVRWRGGVKWEWGSWNGDFRFILSLSSEHFTYVATHDSFQVIRLSVTLGIFQGHWTVSHQISQKRCVIRQKLLWATNRKSYTSFQLVPLLMTLKYIWRSFSLGCHYHVHFSNLWHAFASHGLPAIAELLVAVFLSSDASVIVTSVFKTIVFNINDVL